MPYFLLPAVVRFVEELTYDAPSLLELAGRCVKLTNIPYSSENIPASLVQYLDSAQSCVNPRCNGQYLSFNTCAPAMLQVGTAFGDVCVCVRMCICPHKISKTVDQKLINLVGISPTHRCDWKLVTLDLDLESYFRIYQLKLCHYSGLT